MAEGVAWPLLLGVLGAVFGSFIATVAIRFPAGRSALDGRSMCDGCGRTLRPVELVPLLSYAAQRGRCRSCGATIAPSHLAIETIGAAVGVTAGLLASGLAGAAGAVFGWLLLALGAVDRVAYRLPDALTLVLAASGLAAGAFGLQPTLTDRAIGGVAGFASLWSVATLYRQVRGRVGLGGGDAKMFAGIGLWLGWRALPPVLLIACVTGLVIAVVARKALHDRLPLGSLLAAGAFAVWVAYHWPGRGG